MAPLREKIGETINKLSDRLHKRRASEDGESSQSAKLPKRTPSPPSGTFSAAGMSFLGLKAPGVSSSFHPHKPSHLLLPTPNTTSSSSSSSYNRHSPAPSLSSLSSLSDDMVGSDGGTISKSKKLRRRTRKSRYAPMESFVEPTSTDSAVPEPPIFEDAGLPTFGEYLAALSCNDPKCSEPMPLTREQLAARMRSCLDAKAGQGLLHSFLRCGKCKTFSCAGMYCPRHMKTLDLQKMKSVSGRPDQKIAWCCDAGRQFLILAVACGPGPTLDGKSRSDSKAPKGAAKSLLQTTGKKTSKSKAGQASANVSKLSQGTGYGGTPSTSSLHHSWTQGASSVAKIAAPLKKAAINKADQELELYFFALSQLLPSQPLGGAASSFDHRSHAGIAEILARSPLLPLASEVLRRSCVEDMGCQHQLYLSLLQFLVGISRHTDLRRVIFQPQTRYPEPEQVAAIAFGPAGGTLRPSPAAYDTTQSLDTLLQQLAKFCRHFADHAQRYPGELEDTDEARPLSVAKAVIATVNELQFSRAMAASAASMDRASAKNPGLGPLPNVLTRSRAAKMATADDEDREGKLMAEWHRDHCVKEVPDETIMDGFAFAKEAQALKGQASEKGRMKSLVIQMASLSADLPQGIYVRHGASRLDVIKVLIMGPKGTPYANGVFEFDMFCDSKFPSRPPHMMFRTTGGGTVEFNPNLYVNGKVCLSLLGTWSGQSWEPHRSTILQILVSIQGMIFNSAPWYNEPGREYNLDDARSGTYSKAIWGHTLRHATLYWLKSRLFTPPSSKGKGPLRVVPQGAKVAADAAASANQAPANPNKVTDNQPQWSTHKLPDQLMFWDMDGGDDNLGGMLQHKASSSSKSAPLPQTIPLSQTPKVSLPATSQANQPGASSTSALDHPPLTANLHPSQVPPGMPLSHSFSNFGTSAQWAQLNMPQNVDTLSEDPAYMSYFQSVDAWQTMYENQLQTFAQNTQHLDFDPHHSLHFRYPVQSTVAPDRDDVLWGETLRAYFSAMASTIVDTALASPYQTDPAVIGQLKDALGAHKFI